MLGAEVLALKDGDVLGAAATFCLVTKGPPFGSNLRSVTFV